MSPAVQTRALADTATKPALKRQQTRAAILDAALTLAATVGLQGLSIGALADAAAMSKSGVFAHFGSREELQISVIREYHARFEAEVFVPAMREGRGLPRLAALVDRWLRRVSAEIDSGCIYISGAVEFDDRPGPVRDALVAMIRTWHRALERAIDAAIAAGHLRADVDPQQLLFELHGLVLALHHDARLMRNPVAAARARLGFERLLDRCAVVHADGAADVGTTHQPDVAGAPLARNAAAGKSASREAGADKSALRKPARRKSARRTPNSSSTV